MRLYPLSGVVVLCLGNEAPTRFRPLNGTIGSRLPSQFGRRDSFLIQHPRAAMALRT